MNLIGGTVFTSRTIRRRRATCHETEKLAMTRKRGGALVFVLLACALAACGSDPSTTDADTENLVAHTPVVQPTAPASPEAIIAVTPTAAQPTPTETAPAPTQPPDQASNAQPAGSAVWPTVPAGWGRLTTDKTYHDPDKRYTIDYPYSWTMLEQDKVKFTSSDGKATLTVSATEVGGLMIERKLVEQATQELRDEYGVKFDDEDPQTGADGRIQVDFTIRADEPISGKILIDYRRTTMFVLTTQAPKSLLDRYEDDFTMMIDSYTIDD